MATHVIVVPDDNAAAAKLQIPPGIVATLGPNMIYMSGDNMRMYVRKTMYENMQASAKLTGG